MAEGRELGVVGQRVHAEPPAAEHRGHEGSHQAAHVDEHIENLEAGVALRGIFGIVIELTHDGLEVALEKTVAEGDEEEGETGHRQKP